MKKKQPIRHKIVIIGGGPSGSFAAHWASKLGINTCIIDKQIFPRDKICGDCIPPLAIELMSELSLDFPTSIAPKVNRVNKMIFKKELLEINMPISKAFYNIRRIDFDNYLWGTIPKDVIKLDGSSLTFITFSKATGKHLIQLKNKNSEVIEIEADYIIGADGANSWIRKKLDYFQSMKINFNTAKRAYTSNGNLPNLDNLIVFGSNVKTYSWLFKLSDDIYNIGEHHCYHEESKLNKSKIQEIENKYQFTADWNTYHGAPIPICDSTLQNTFATNGVFLVGDAAGLCDPFFGHGIDVGMLSGKIAIQSIHKSEANFLSIRKKRRATKMYSNYINNHIMAKYRKVEEYLKLKDTSNLLDAISMFSQHTITSNNS